MVFRRKFTHFSDHLGRGLICRDGIHVFFSMTDLPEMQVVLKIGGSIGFNTKMVYFWMIGGTPPF